MLFLEYETAKCDRCNEERLTSDLVLVLVRSKGKYEVWCRVCRDSNHRRVVPIVSYELYKRIEGR